MAGKSRWENDESDSEEEEIPRKQSAISRIESIKSVSSLTDVKRLDSLEASEAGEAREAAEASPNDNDTTEKERMLRETLLKRMEAKPAEPSEGPHSVDGTPPDSAVGGGAAVGAAAVAPSPSVGASGMLNLRGCRNVDQSFETFTRIDEGTYGVVFKAHDRFTHEVVALKRVKLNKEREGFPITALREVTILLRLRHPNIVDVKEVVVDRTYQKVYMVMEYADHDLKSLMEVMQYPFSQSEVKCLMVQLVSAVKYMHDNWIIHRDLKLSNLLYNNRGQLKVCDLGLARTFGNPLKMMTSLVVTLWYRAPELLLGCAPLAPAGTTHFKYSTPIDVWSVGCIFAELLIDEPLFNGKGEHDQIDKIFKLLGTPADKPGAPNSWPGWSALPGAKKITWRANTANKLRAKFAHPAAGFGGGTVGVLSDVGYSLMSAMLTYDPDKRISIGDALDHRYFQEGPPPQDQSLMPTYPATQDANKRKRKREKTPELGGGYDDDSHRFSMNADRAYGQSQKSQKEQLLAQLDQLGKR